MKEMINAHGYFQAFQLARNLPKVTIATVPRKYSKYNGHVVVCKPKRFAIFALLYCHAEVYIWQRRRAFPVFLSLSLPLSFFLNTSISRFFSCCSHSKLEVLKISGRKGRVSPPPPLSLFPFFSGHVVS